MRSTARPPSSATISRSFSAASVAFFFIAIWGLGGVLLTPELKTNSTLIGIIQLGIAAGMVSRRTMPLSALGIFTLYAVAVWNYGVFHLADYPVFLGVAAYLALTGLQKNFFGARPIDVLRWAAGITLMWASIEKWAYPEWSYPLFIGQAGNVDGLYAGFLHAGGRRGRVRFGVRVDLDAAGAARRRGRCWRRCSSARCSNSARSI